MQVVWREKRWQTSWQDARLRLVKEDSGGTVTRSSQYWHTPWSRRDERKNVRPLTPIQFIREGEKPSASKKLKASFRKHSCGR